MGEGSSIAVSCSVGRSCDLDLTLLWLRFRLAAVTLIRPLAWELPYTVGVSLKKKKKIQQHVHMCSVRSKHLNYSFNAAETRLYLPSIVL